MQLGIFKNLKIHIDTSKGEGATKNGYEVTFQGDELSRITGSIGTELGQNDGAATAGIEEHSCFFFSIYFDDNRLIFRTNVTKHFRTR